MSLASADNQIFEASNYRAILDHMLNGVAYCCVSHDQGQPIDFVFLYTNPAFEKLTGLKDVIGKPVSKVIPGIHEADPILLDVINRVARGGAPQKFENSIESLAQRFSISVYSPQNEHFVAVFEVINDQQQNDDIIINSEKEVRLMAEAMPQIVWICRSDGRNIFFNHQWMEYTGLSLEESYGHGWNIPFHPDDQQRAWDAWQNAVNNNGSYSLECRLRRADGQYRWWLIRGVPAFDASGLIYRWYGTCTDIHEIKQNQAELIDYRNHLEKLVAEQTESLCRAKQIAEGNDRRKDEFLAMLAHELRNPLAPIRNAAFLLKQEGTDSSRIGWCGEIIDRQITHLTQLVDDLLDVSRINRGTIQLHKEALEIWDIIHLSLESCQPLIDAHRQELSMDLPPERLWVEGDRIRLSQVLSNLINNAVKFTQIGGRLGLSVQVADGKVCIRVTDNGCGIDPADLPNIFTMFYQAESNLDRSKGGLGIGLAIVHNLVAMHGGDLQAFSRGLGQGSEFIVRLPLLTPPEPTLARVERGTAQLLRKLRFLVVDDNRDVADSMTVVLQTDGHEVQTAYDSPTALAIAKTERPDVILMDIGLPGMNGYEVAQELRRNRELDRTLLIALTGYGRVEEREKSRASGFNKHLVKPLDIELLRTILNEYQRNSLHE